jgi:hypothetical protein
MAGLYDLWKENVPMRERFYLQTLFGDRDKPFTKKDMTPKGLKQIEESIQTARQSRTKRAQEELSRAKQSQERENIFFQRLETSLPILEKAAKEDPEWLELQSLEREPVEIAGAAAIAAAKGDRDRKWELSRILQDRYSSMVGSEHLFFSMLHRPEQMASYFDDYKEQYRGTSERRDSAQEIISRLSSDRPSSDVQYEDYAFTGPGWPGQHDPTKHWDNVGQTLGRYNYRTNEAGEREVIDAYDFSNPSQDAAIDAYEKLGPIRKALLTAERMARRVVQGQGIKGAAQEIGNAYVGRDGRPVKITYDPKTYASGGVVIDDGNPAKRRRII